MHGHGMMKETFFGMTDGGSDDFTQRVPVFFQLEAAGFETGHVEEVGDEAFHAF